MDENYTPAVQDTPSFNAGLTKVLSSASMLAVAILLTVSQAVSILTGNGFEILIVLLTIAAWMLYAAAKKETINHNGLSIVSGVVKAESIFDYIGGIGCLILSGLMFWVYASFDTLFPYIEEAMTEINEELPSVMTPQITEYFELIGIDFSTLFSEEVLAVFLLAVSVFMLLFGIITLVLAILFGKLNKCTKSLCISAQSGENKLVKVSFAKGFVMFLGIICALSALGSVPFNLEDVSLFISQGLMCAVYFIVFGMIKKATNKN